MSNPSTGNESRRPYVAPRLWPVTANRVLELFIEADKLQTLEIERLRAELAATRRDLEVERKHRAAQESR